MHFTPTSSSWLNLVERWFREISDKALRRRVFHSVPDLISSIEEYLDSHNDNQRPYVWTATAESILTKVALGRVALETVSKIRDTPLATRSARIASMGTVAVFGFGELMACQDCPRCGFGVDGIALADAAAELRFGRSTSTTAILRWRRRRAMPAQ